MSHPRCQIDITFPEASAGTTTRSLLVSVNGRASNINIPVSCLQHTCFVDWNSLFFLRLQDTGEGNRTGERAGDIREAALFVIPSLLDTGEFSSDGLLIVLTNLP